MQQQAPAGYGYPINKQPVKEETTQNVPPTIRPVIYGNAMNNPPSPPSHPQQAFNNIPAPIGSNGMPTRPVAYPPGSYGNQNPSVLPNTILNQAPQMNAGQLRPISPAAGANIPPPPLPLHSTSNNLIQRPPMPPMVPFPPNIATMASQPLQQGNAYPESPRMGERITSPMHSTAKINPVEMDALTSRIRGLSTNKSGDQPSTAAVPSWQAPRGILEQSLSGGGMAGQANANSNQPVGIVGQPLPLEDLRKAPNSPISPTLNSAYTRVTLQKVPKSSATLHKTRLPFGISVTPYPVGVEDSTVQVIDGPIVRCRRCRAYLNPYVQIQGQGMIWKCNLCFFDNEFPAGYDYDQYTQKQIDRNRKAELTCPVYEFIAPLEYTIRTPQPLVYLFVIDVAYNSIASGLCSAASRIIASALDGIPDSQERTKIGLITVDSSIHFYQFAGDETKMMVISDLEEPFLPCSKDLLVSLNESRTLFEKTLKDLPTFFANTQTSTSAMGSALSVASKLLAPIGGKIVLITATLPTVGEGKLIARDDSKLYGTSKENTLLQPANNYYKSLATECQRVHICIDMFLFPHPFLDIATIGCAARFTGGHVYMYEQWDAQSSEAVEKFAGDLTSLIQAEVGLEAVIRIRASQGVSLTTYHGSFFLRSADLLSLPNVNKRHTFTAQVAIDENISSPLICFQTAVLHTNCHGERRIRVLNAAYPVTDDPREIFAFADVGAVSDLLLKMAAEKVLSHKLEDARDALQNKIIDILTAIKTIYQTGQNPQLLVSESLRLLPLIILAILKSPTIRGGTFTNADTRSYYLALVKVISVVDSLFLLYPYMFAIHTMPNECGWPAENATTADEIVMPTAMNLGSEVLERHGLYILDDGQDIIIYVGSQIHPELCQLVFGQTYNALLAGRHALPQLDNPWSCRIKNILDRQRRLHGNNPSIFIVKEDGDLLSKTMFLQHLIEDKGLDGQVSYAAWTSMLRDKVYASH